MKKMYLDLNERKDYIYIEGNENKFYPHPTIEKLYCSMNGEVAMTRHEINRFKEEKTYILNQHMKPNGYSRVAWGTRDEKGNKVMINHLVHRLIAECFIPTPNDTDKFEVDHIVSVHDLNNVSNLRWVTKQENLKKRDESGVLLKKTFVYDIQTDSMQEYISRQLAAKATNLQTSNLCNAIKYEQVVRNRYFISDIELTTEELSCIFKEHFLHQEHKKSKFKKYNREVHNNG